MNSVQARLNQRAAIDATHVVSMTPGFNTTTIDAVVTTASGDEGVLMVLDEDGKLPAWKWSDRIQPIETTALDFTPTWQQDAGLPRGPRCPSNSRRSWPREIWNANGPSSARCQVGSARSRTL